MSKFRTICETDDVPKGSSRMFVVNELIIGIFNVDGEFFALDNRCPHAGASLAHGIMDGNIVTCRIHHWRFCLSDGAYLDANRPEFNARCFPVRIVGKEVQVEI